MIYLLTYSLLVILILYLVIYFSGEISNDRNVDFAPCHGNPCETNEYLNFTCEKKPVDYFGHIKSPSFPDKITDETQFGTYTLYITADCQFTTNLTLDRPNFLIGLLNNTFTVGKGEKVDKVNGVIGPPLHGTEKFPPDDAQTLFYDDSGSSSIWVQIDVSDGFFWFDFTYNITTFGLTATEETTTETSTVDGATNTEETTTDTLTEGTSAETNTETSTGGTNEGTNTETSTDTTTETSTVTTKGTTSEISTGTTNNGSSFTTASTTTSTSGAPTTTSPNLKNLCDKYDPYGVHWTSYTSELLEKNCNQPETSGTTFWECDCPGNNQQCEFKGSQPDFSDCESSELNDIIQSVNNPDIPVIDIWMNIDNFTFKNGYYGQDIFPILINVTYALLNRMQREIDENKFGLNQTDFLKIQINSTFYATETMDNLVNNGAQWIQLNNQNVSDKGMLTLLSVSNEIAFRLANVSKWAEVPLLCENSFLNVTIYSSYWDGTQEKVLDCNLTSMVPLNTSRYFPTRKKKNKLENTASYIELPEDIGKSGYKIAGVYIGASNLLKLILSGSHNSAQLDYKEINSPLISYTLYHPEADFTADVATLPNGSYVQLVFKHEVTAKYPPVRTIRRDPDGGEENSAVIGSSICSFLELSKTNSNGNWSWNNEGCRVLSTNSTHTVCKCSHLTGFADLMAFHDFVGRSVALDVTSITCTILSTICLATTFVILLMFRALKMKRTFITQNLCITLIISYLMILFTLDKRLFGLNEATCAVMGIMLHYMLLTSFMWMLLEGFQLYRMSVHVFDVRARKFTIFYATVAYTVPMIIVATTVLIADSFDPIPYNETSDFTMTGIMQAYSGDETCWLVGNWVWAFNGPVIIIIVANCRFLITGIFSTFKLIENINKNPKNLIRGMSLRVLSLTFLLGISWMFGLLLFTEWLAFAFIFTIANGLQGVVIFIDRCILNKKIRNAIAANLNHFKIYLNNKWNKNTVTSKGPTVQSDLQNSVSNMFDRSFSRDSLNDSIGEILPRIRWHSYKNSTFNV